MKDEIYKILSNEELIQDNWHIACFYVPEVKRNLVGWTMRKPDGTVWHVWLDEKGNMHKFNAPEFSSSKDDAPMWFDEERLRDERLSIDRLADIIQTTKEYLALGWKPAKARLERDGEYYLVGFVKQDSNTTYFITIQPDGTIKNGYIKDDKMNTNMEIEYI